MSEFGLFSMFPPGVEFAIVDMETEPIDQTKGHIACLCKTIKKYHSNKNKYKSEGDWSKYPNNSNDYTEYANNISNWGRKIQNLL